jgi:two-component system, OmpR family, alkaline phosphatase synthesis response regulator PhoP
MAKRILIVEDEPDLMAYFKLALARTGFELEMASNGHEAVRRARELRPDLVLMDVMLPGITGIEACRRLSADPDLANVRVVMLSSRTEDEVQQSAREAGAIDYWTKPVGPTELQAKVQSVLEQSSTTDGMLMG